MNKLKNLIVLFILLLSLSTLYLYQLNSVPSTGKDLEVTHDRTIFEEGYHYLTSEKFDEALTYYNSIENEFEDQYYSEKHDRLMVILNRLKSASELYISEKELLELAETFKIDILDKWYEPLLEIYDFYHLSQEVILEDNYDREEELINNYLNNSNSFEEMLTKVNKVDSQFFNSEDKENFLKSIEYSVFPTSAYYKITYLSESITFEDIEKVENSWDDWDSYYNKVMDYYQNFDEGLYYLNEEVVRLKDGYTDIKRQLTLLIPDLKFDQFL